MESFADLADACRRSPPRLVFVLGSGMGTVAQELQGTSVYRSRRFRDYREPAFTDTRVV